MGMSASQARLLSLEARQSNLEYQGQQINQERSVLSQQATALYETLNSMTVPTPPSTTDYTTVQYTGKSGTVTYTFDASNVKPDSDGNYIVTLGYTEYGSSLSKNNGYKTTSVGEQKINVSAVATSTTTTKTGYTALGEKESADATDFLVKVDAKPTSGVYYILDSDGFYVKGGDEDETYKGGYYTHTTTKPTGTDNYIAVKGDKKETTTTNTFTAAQIQSFYVDDGDGNAVPCTLDMDGIVPAEDGSDTYTIDTSILKNVWKINPAGSTKELTIPNKSGYIIGGYNAYALTAENVGDQAEFDGYCEAIENSGLKQANGKPYTAEHFFIYYDSENKIHFALKNEVQKANTEQSNTCITYDFISNGSYTKNKEYKGSKLHFDPSSGRITSIDIPSTDTKGNIVSYSTIDVSAKTVTDNNAYKDAYNEYEYSKYEYDKKNQEINAKTEIIQQQDKNLELKLQRLDNERTQITTEIEAVQKVIKDNIESSYKTFNG